MTKKKHKTLPPETLNAFKYEVALELGVLEPSDTGTDGGSRMDSANGGEPLEIDDGLIGAGTGDPDGIQSGCI